MEDQEQSYDLSVFGRRQSEAFSVSPILTKEHVSLVDRSLPASIGSATLADIDQQEVTMAESIPENPSSSESGEQIGTKLLALSNPAHMDVIDKLRDLGVHNFVELPQLVVVGDQCSGKSSVLETIVNVPFPRDATLCTKFATNITLRRQSKESVHVSIIPGKSASQDNAERLRRWSYETKKLDGNKFLEALKLASNAMGVHTSTDACGDGWKTFSDDMFKIEITGPHLINLSVIDVPGLFQTKQDNETTDDDIAFVEEMVKGYLQNSRTIILAVLASNNDVANQSILRMVEQADPGGWRTLGVLTKPDLLDKGTEYTIMDLVNGKKHKLNHGYYVVRNRSKMEQSRGRLEMEEIERQFFNTNPWNQLPRNRVGGQSLLVKLQHILGDLFGRELPVIKAQIENSVVERKQDLARMGQERASEADQRRFLERIANQFQDICRDAMNISYHRHMSLRKGVDMRLPTLVANRKEQFGREMTWDGHSIAFIDTDLTTTNSEDIEAATAVDNEETSSPLIEEYSERKQTEDELDCMPLSLLRQAGKGRKPAVKGFPELSALFVPVPKFVPPRHKNIRDWIESVVRETRSYSLEIAGPDVLSLLWKEQAEKWGGISTAFIYDIIILVHRFIDGLLSEVCPDQRTHTLILLVIKDDLLSKYKDAIKAVDFLFKVEQNGALLTENHYFGETLQKVREKRSKEAIIHELKKMSMRGNVFNENDMHMIEENLIRESDLSKLRLERTTKSNLEHAVDDLHDILYCYYKTARKRFVDAVLMQAMDFHLLTGPPSPLHLFTSSYVSNLTPEQLENVAGEDTASKKRRRDLKKEIDALEGGKEVFRQAELKGDSII